MNLKNDKGNVKLVAIIVTLLVIIIAIILIMNLNKDKSVQTPEKVPYEYFTVSNSDGKVGVIDKQGKSILAIEYEHVYIPNQSKDVFICFKDEVNYSILNSKGKDLFSNYETVFPIVISEYSLEMEKNVLSYEEEGKYGLIDYNGNKLTPAVYEEVSSLKNKPGCIQVKKDGLYGVLDSNGKTIIDTKYNSIKGDEFSSEKDGYLRTGYIVSNKTKTGIYYGYIDYNGKMLVEPVYESITRALEDDGEDIYLIFMDHGKKGVMKNKKEIIKPKYISIIYQNNSDIFIVSKNSKYGFIDRDGKEILPAEYQTYSIAGDYISVTKNDEMLLFDLHGNLVNTNRYKSVIGTNDPSIFIAEMEDGYYSIISKDMEIKDRYTNIVHAFDNFFVFTNDEGKSGVLDLYAGVEIKPIYDYIIILENSRVLEARVGNICDIYSEKMEKVISMENVVVEQVKKDYTSVYSENEIKYINNVGELVQNTEVYKDIPLYSYQADDGKWGFKNQAGQLVVDCKYDRVTELNEYGFAGIVQDNKWGVIDSTGKVIVVPTYEIESYYSPKFVGKYLLEAQESVYCVELEDTSKNVAKKPNKVQSNTQGQVPELPESKKKTEVPAPTSTPIPNVSQMQSSN